MTNCFCFCFALGRGILISVSRPHPRQDRESGHPQLGSGYWRQCLPVRPHFPTLEESFCVQTQPTSDRVHRSTHPCVHGFSAQPLLRFQSAHSMSVSGPCHRLIPHPHASLCPYAFWYRKHHARHRHRRRHQLRGRTCGTVLEPGTPRPPRLSSPSTPGNGPTRPCSRFFRTRLPALPKASR